MGTRESSAAKTASELFRYYPDYLLCRALAESIDAGRLSMSSAIQQLASRARALEMNQPEIEQKLDRQCILIRGRPVPVKALSLRRILRLDDGQLASVVKFYFKHPFAHGRTLKSRCVPRWLRSIFLRVILGHAKNRNLDLNYPIYFEMLRIL